MPEEFRKFRTISDDFGENESPASARQGGKGKRDYLELKVFQRLTLRHRAGLKRNLENFSYVFT